MKSLIKHIPSVADSFFNMTAAIREASVLKPKENELILIGIFTASRSLKGIHTHVERAISHGATKEEIISSVSLALPVCGIASVNMALDEAIKAFKHCSNSQEFVL